MPEALGSGGAVLAPTGVRVCVAADGSEFRGENALVTEGLDGLWDIAPGRGQKPTYQIDRSAAIVDAILQTKPAGTTHWSCRTMAQSRGVSKSTVNNIWRAHNLQPHRTETFKLSRDP
jgi:hypothetical protein